MDLKPRQPKFDVLPRSQQPAPGGVQTPIVTVRDVELKNLIGDYLAIQPDGSVFGYRGGDVKGSRWVYIGDSYYQSL